MSWQRIKLNMIPDTKVLPVVHASQFDSNRSISFQMFTGEDEWTIPEGLTIELHCRKVDDNIVTLAPSSVDGSVITFITTEQLTACSGQNKCELSFIDADDLVIGSLNFILDVEPDPLKGGLTSASSIYDLTQQIEDIAQEVIGEDYYDKTEVDALLADKADVSDLPDMSQYYTKTATDTLLNAKADKSDTYTKVQVDTALAAKANTADLATVATSGDYDDLINKPVIPAAQVQSDYAQADNTQVDYIKNKPDINAMIAAAIFNILPVDTASGNPCSFDTEVAAPIQSLTAEIVASGGGGTPSTPIPIVGHSELNLVRCGKNLLKNEQVQRTEYSVMIGQSSLATYETYLVGGQPYHLQFEATGTSVVAYYKYENGDQFNINSNGNFTPIRSGNIQMWLYAADLDISSVRNFMLELGSTATAYEPYNGTPYLVSFGQTVYGGVYDANRGKVRITHELIDLGDLGYGRTTSYNNPIFYANLSATYKGFANSLCSCYRKIADGSASSFASAASNYDFGFNSNGYGQLFIRNDDYSDTNAFQTAMVGQEVIFELATPIEIDVSELSVNAIVGTNNITSDGGGDVSVSYNDSIQHYIDNQ